MFPIKLFAEHLILSAFSFLFMAKLALLIKSSYAYYPLPLKDNHFFVKHKYKPEGSTCLHTLNGFDISNNRFNHRHSLTRSFVVSQNT